MIKESSSKHNNELSKEEVSFLDKNGYLIIEDALSKDQIEQVKKELEKLKKEEGLRAGDVRTSQLREKLTSQRGIIPKVKLFFLDSTFKVLRTLFSYLRKNHAFNEMLYMYSLRPSIYAERPYSKKHELTLMIINIVQQAESKVERLCNLANKGEVFDVFYTHKKVMSAVEHLIGKGKFKLSSLNYRNPKKESVNQPLHIDFPWAVKSSDCFSSNTLWLMDDMTTSNGPTRIVPGTHKREVLPYCDLDDVSKTHPDEIYITAKAGSVIILNGHVWHGGTGNISGEDRGIIQSFFVHRAHYSQQFQRNLLTSSTIARSDERALQILDYQ